jgi:hypothetical protein
MPMSNSFDDERKAAIPWEGDSRLELNHLDWRTIANPFSGLRGSDGGWDFLAKKGLFVLPCNAKHMKRFTCDDKVITHIEYNEVYPDLMIENRKAYDDSVIQAKAFIIRFFNEGWFCTALAKNAEPVLKWDKRGYYVVKYMMPVSCLAFHPMKEKRWG